MAKKAASQPGSAESPDAGDLSFEQAFAELEQIVEKLESGDLTLEASLALHSRGQLLSALCARQLDQAELRVREVKSDS